MRGVRGVRGVCGVVLDRLVETDRDDDGVVDIVAVDLCLLRGVRGGDIPPALPILLVVLCLTRLNPRTVRGVLAGGGGGSGGSDDDEGGDEANLCPSSWSSSSTLTTPGLP